MFKGGYDPNDPPVFRGPKYTTGSVGDDDDDEDGDNSINDGA